MPTETEREREIPTVSKVLLNREDYKEFGQIALVSINDVFFLTDKGNAVNVIQEELGFNHQQYFHGPDLCIAEVEGQMFVQILRQ